MKGFKKALISIFALHAYRTVRICLAHHRVCPVRCSCKNFSNRLAFVHHRWRCHCVVVADKTFCSFCKSAYRCNRGLVLSGTAYELSRFFYDELKR